jgi:hypothetical protein
VKGEISLFTILTSDFFMSIDLVDKAAARTRVPLLSMMPAGRPSSRPSSPRPSSMMEVSGPAIAEVLSEKMGLPREIVQGPHPFAPLPLGEGNRVRVLLSLEAELKERIKGQDEAIDCVGRRLMMAQAGIAERRGPLAVFLFLGPTGVGKTETARQLAVHLFGSESQMIRLDMSEYMEEHSAAIRKATVQSSSCKMQSSK